MKLTKIKEELQEKHRKESLIEGVIPQTKKGKAIRKALKLIEELEFIIKDTI